MRTLLPILILSVLFAYMTEKTTAGEYGSGSRQSSENKFWFFLLVMTLALPIGLRTSYNDTDAYIRSFQNSETISELLASGELHILSNPAFDLYTALMRTLTGNYHLYLLIPAVFVQYSFVSTIRRYTPSLPLGVLLYICLDTYVFSMAAMKQVTSMAILMLAIPSLLDGKVLRYYLLVFVAFLFHTYAIAFVILPFFTVKPWSLRTLALVFIVFTIMNNFQSVIGSFLEYANDSGKSVAEYEVFDNNQINTFRVLVYAVVPLMSLVLLPYLFRGEYNKEYNLLIHMSIISFAVMLLGTINGANMFGRMANYFEFGIICSMHWIINKAFEHKSAHLVTTIATVCFFLYFTYANAIAGNFDSAYRGVTLIEFIQSLFTF